MDYAYNSLELYVVPLRSDNYSYVIHDKSTAKTLIVDPSETEPLIKFLEQKGFGLDFILDTHHHDDHTQGNIGLQKHFAATIVASASDVGRDRIPGRVGKALAEAETFIFGAYTFRVLSTPGHTLGHISFFLEGANWLFSGDTLFALGCGRLFEGTADMMWKSFLKLRDLPGATLVFCGHEYTLSNARFAATVGHDWPGFSAYIKGLEQRFQKEGRTIPTRLSDETAYNPFFRADHPSLASLGETDTAVFAELRKRKDSFQ